MKKLIIAFIYLICSVIVYAEEFSISKVNRIEKLWVIPPDRRTFIGSRGIQKFDYERPIRNEQKGEDYIVTWRYSGKELARHLVLRFEYRLDLNQKDLYVEKYSYKSLKRGTYKWKFVNIGSRFAEEGKVDRWKASLVLSGKVVAEKRSASWKAMEGT